MKPYLDTLIVTCCVLIALVGLAFVAVGSGIKAAGEAIGNAAIRLGDRTEL